MTLRVERFGDVGRVRMSSVGGRLAGIDVSAYVVRGVMIDTGFIACATSSRARCLASASKGVIVTHWHEDHAGNVAAFARRRNADLDSRADTESMLRARPEIQLYRRSIWGRPPPLESASCRLRRRASSACTRRDIQRIITSCGTPRPERYSPETCGSRFARACCIRRRTRTRSSRVCAARRRSPRLECSMRTADSWRIRWRALNARRIGSAK